MGKTGTVKGLNVANSDMNRTVLLWWRDAHRELPWRETRDPWHILVSEVMSQQTQVERVVPKWRDFIERFPTPAAAAQASAGDLIKMWDGLGYNRRAVMLHHCARQVVEQHDGELPDTLEELLDLPGIGPYTARAVLAFAFERDVAVLDTNVGRVLARLAGRSWKPREAQARADELVPAGGGWEWNQALLDLGAQVCQKRTPQCERCPVQRCCSWRGTGPDPSVGSAGVSTGQSRFDGSDRQGRGRLVAALRVGPVEVGQAPEVMGFGNDTERSSRVLASLLGDGMVVRSKGYLHLP